MLTNIFKSIGSVLAGFITVFALSIMTDLVVEALGILPPAAQPEAYMWWHLLIALIYRSVITVVGGYVTAALAPSKPMKHVIALAVIGTVFGTLGTIGNWDKAVVSGIWYPVALLILSPFCIFLGGKLRTK
jgi:hypothetical protein